MLNIILFEAMAKIMCRQVVKIMCRLTINLKTQTITKTLSLTAGEVKTLTFTFNELTTVCGISDITRTKTSNAYGQYQDINGRYDNPHSFFTITGNTVVIEIQGYVDTSSEAQWSVTAVGK